jgi:hypothetical protein
MVLFPRRSCTPKILPLSLRKGGNCCHRRLRALRPPLAALFTGIASVAGVAAAAQTLDATRRILVLPPLQWDAMGVASYPVTQQATSDLAQVMGGLRFGLKPEEVSQHLPKLGAALRWSDLPSAKDLSEDVRFIRMPMQGAGALRAPVTACFGEPSNVVLLFRDNALFQISWRFLPDQSCSDTQDAAEQLYAPYVLLTATLAVSTRYRAGSAEVVDVADPSAEPPNAQRWREPGQ